MDVYFRKDLGFYGIYDEASDEVQRRLDIIDEHGKRRAFMKLLEDWRNEEVLTRCLGQWTMEDIEDFIRFDFASIADYLDIPWPQLDEEGECEEEDFEEDEEAEGEKV